MKLLFLLLEGMKGFKRARVASMITVATIMLSLCLIGLFGILVENLSEAFQGVYGRIQLEAFLDAGVSDAGVSGVQNRIYANEAVDTVVYISPDQALEEFRAAFEVDFLQVLEDNPLQPLLRITLRSGLNRLEAVEGVAAAVEELEHVDEVEYKVETVRLINRYFWTGVVVAAALGATIFLISTLLIFNTIRLTIHARQRVISIMRLVGATNAFIKAPFILEGLIQGILGGAFSAGLLWLATWAVASVFNLELLVPLNLLMFLLLTGTILGLLGSYISVSRYLKF